MAWRTAIGGVMAAAVLMTGCESAMQKQPQSAMQKQPLYDRLGGKPAIQAVIDDFVGNVAADPRINQRFAGANIPRLKTMLVDQVCEASGGPCRYTGAPMKTAHAGMKISDAEFNALVEDLVKSLDKFKVPAQEKGELLAALGSLKGDIVNQ
jgi:hemoglobin